MSKTPRSPTESVASDFGEGSIFCGVGSPHPKPRLLSGTLFGHVEGAFDEKTLPIGYGCDKKKTPQSSPNGEEEDKQKEEKVQDEEQNISKDGKEEIDEEKKTNEIGVEEVNGKDEAKEEQKENNTDEEERETGPETEEGKGPMPVSEGVSRYLVNEFKLKSI